MERSTSQTQSRSAWLQKTAGRALLAGSGHSDSDPWFPGQGEAKAGTGLSVSGWGGGEAKTGRGAQAGSSTDRASLSAACAAGKQGPWCSGQPDPDTIIEGQLCLFEAMGSQDCYVTQKKDSIPQHKRQHNLDALTVCHQPRENAWGRLPFSATQEEGAGGERRLHRATGRRGAQGMAAPVWVTSQAG